MKKTIHVIGGGTIHHVRNHLGLVATAWGETAKSLAALCEQEIPDLDTHLHLTRMAGGPKDLETVEDVSNLLDLICADPNTKIVFMNAAMVDFGASVMEWFAPTDKLSDKMAIVNSNAYADGNPYGGKYAGRLSSKKNYSLSLHAKPKVISGIRKNRKDIFLIGFKTTVNATEDEQYLAGLDLLKKSSCNLVLANDVFHHRNMIITPEEARYCVTTNRKEVLRELVKMAKLRSQLTFTRSTVVDGQPVPWDSPEVFPALRTVVDHCIKLGAYKPFNGATVGHFACKINDNTFLTSIRKSNFNDLHKLGLVRIVTDGPDSVIAYGAKPSVGGQSQRIVFSEHPEYDSIVHFHCPIRPGSKVPTVSQREYECGSHQCGDNTSKGLTKFGNLSVIYLDQHGPNIVFHHSINPQEVIDFIEANFDLADKTGGPVSLPVESSKKGWSDYVVR